MAAPNIVNVATITGITTFKAGINTESAGVSVIVTNAASSGKVLKINSLVASGIGATTEVTVRLHNLAAGAGNTVSIATSVTVPTFSSLVIIGKDNSIYVQENQSISAIKNADAGDIDIICSLEDISQVLNMGYLGGRIGKTQNTGTGARGENGNLGGGIMDLFTQGYFAREDKIGTGPSGPAALSASGGSTATANGFKYHFFTSTGPATFVVSSGSGSIDFIVIGGGGAGGSYRGAGGGAGGLNSNFPGFPGSYGGEGYAVTPGTYPITVGDGGSDPGGSSGGDSGDDSVFNGPGVNGGSPITGSGGGGGAGFPSNDGGHTNGKPGGSGGGGRDNTSGSGTGNGGESSKTTGEIGNDGGYADEAYGGAGGGGAGGAGGNKTSPSSSPTYSVGGIGYGFDDIPSDYGTAGPDGSKRYFAGGGAGHVYPNTPKSGGYGGGGASAGPNSSPGIQGTNNTGGGGGGGGENSPRGGDGGTGIVIIRYPE